VVNLTVLSYLLGGRVLPGVVAALVVVVVGVVLDGLVVVGVVGLVGVSVTMAVVVVTESSTDKTDCHNITEILLKVALNTVNQPILL
jgi:chromate transport protein ChrA